MYFMWILKQNLTRVHLFCMDGGTISFYDSVSNNNVGLFIDLFRNALSLSSHPRENAFLSRPSISRRCHIYKTIVTALIQVIITATIM